MGSVDRSPRAPTIGETILRESLTGRELFRLPLHGAALMRAPRGTGGPVLLLPGLAATDASLAPLRGFLARLGHDPRPSGLGRISPDVAHTVPLVLERLREIRRETGRPVALVGQSIGGVLARESTRLAPSLVRRIVTFGTPVTGGPDFTATRTRYTSEQRRRIRAAIAARARVPIPVPITAIWSPNDGIVAPSACIDRVIDHVEHVEVSSSHLGMGLDPDVWLIVAKRLALD
jgi:pimeloyl-ACP methyl ester carboxylesterase